MIKKLLSVALCGLLLISAAGCGAGDQAGGSASGQASDIDLSVISQQFEEANAVEKLLESYDSVLQEFTYFSEDGGVEAHCYEEMTKDSYKYYSDDDTYTYAFENGEYCDMTEEDGQLVYAAACLAGEGAYDKYINISYDAIWERDELEECTSATVEDGVGSATIIYPYEAMVEDDSCAWMIDEYGIGETGCLSYDITYDAQTMVISSFVLSILTDADAEGYVRSRTDITLDGTLPQAGQESVNNAFEKIHDTSGATRTLTSIDPSTGEEWSVTVPLGVGVRTLASDLYETIPYADEACTISVADTETDLTKDLVVYLKRAE